MNNDFYAQLVNTSLKGRAFTEEILHAILTSQDIELLPLLNAAFEIRTRFHGQAVTIHIINNAQNGYCPEDCHYCVQAKSSRADIEEYPLKSDEEILAEAKSAYEKGAYRYCMVFAGREPSQKRVEHLSRLIRDIKLKFLIEVCVSPGIIDLEKARLLKKAGLDRLNHNLNTSQQNYPNICTTHTFEDRINTLRAARQAELQLCSGVIIGMGEKASDIIEMARTLREMNVESIPVNFFIPIEGTQLKEQPALDPAYCLRVLCLFRFVNPEADIRMAAGREIYLRQMEVMGLYPANSLFMEGYLNTKGTSRSQTLQMIKDAGFSIRSEYSLDDLLREEKSPSCPPSDSATKSLIKGLKDLRPHLLVQE
ncbi:MAG: biotin synthase BioB [Omnitrophica WOR_2 bacterium GWC2_45_7]|nr:MAG: biotin synthase BioB [Omnitrophica WOR_2 bacterium GWC2_45_7]